VTYEEFLEFVPSKCMYETIYDDSNGCPILVIRMLDAYSMVNKAPKKEWVGLTDEEIMGACAAVWASHPIDVGRIIEAKLKERNS